MGLVKSISGNVGLNQGGGGRALCSDSLLSLCAGRLQEPQFPLKIKLKPPPECGLFHALTSSEI